MSDVQNGEEEEPAATELEDDAPGEQVGDED